MTTTSGRDRLGIVLRWPIGIALVSWRYMWRTTPLHRSEEAGGQADLPSRVAGAPQERLQPLDAGTGPMLHRTYSVRITDSTMTPAALIDLVAANMNRASPEMAVFRRTGGGDGRLKSGDEFVVRMPGPWDGPVRVVRREPGSFRFPR